MEHIRKTSKKLGVGSRGVVYEGYDEERGRFVAVKEIPFFDDGVYAGSVEDMEEEKAVLNKESLEIVREISIMERFEHPNLVTYYGARRSSIGVQIIMEFVNGGSLDALIRRQGSLREGVVRSYTHDILEGLAYLHDTARVCHRDIKPGNVLITADGRCKLADFGVSKILDDNASMRTTVGTPWYMAPEVIDSSADNHDDYTDMEEEHNNRNDNGCNSSLAGSYTTAADIWSLGVTVFEMISGKKPFGNGQKNSTAILFAILSAAKTPPRLPDNCEVSSSLRAFLDLCFLHDPWLRPTARELLTHQWFLEKNTVSSSRTSRGTIHGRRRSSDAAGSEFVWAASASPQLSMSMLDTADLAGGSPRQRKMSSSSSRSIEDPIITKRKAPVSVADGATGGFLGRDGYYVDLFFAEPLPPPP